MYWFCSQSGGSRYQGMEGDSLVSDTKSVSGGQQLAPNLHHLHLPLNHSILRDWEKKEGPSLIVSAHLWAHQDQDVAAQSPQLGPR